MIKQTTLENIIRTFIPLPVHTNAKGWHSVLCKVCNDHGKKGKRAGFRFDHGTTGYNCFNCGHTASFNPNEDSTLSDNMITVLNSFGIPEDEYRVINFQQLGKRFDRENSFDGKIHVNTKDSQEPTEIPLPDHFYRLTNDESDKWAVIAWDYLEHERGIDPLSYPFYLSTGEGKDAKKWLGRLIIPIYRDNKLVFYQGRLLIKSLEKTTKKYLSVDVPRDRVLYGYDNILDENLDTPLYIVEGWFDAKAIDGVAIFGNKLTGEQIAWLNRTNRQKVMIPDRYGDGQLVAERVLKMGWAVSFPDIGDSCKDMSDAVKKYGKLYVLQSIVAKTVSGFEAEAATKLYCKGRSKKGGSSGNGRTKGSSHKGQEKT